LTNAIDSHLRSPSDRRSRRLYSAGRPERGRSCWKKRSRKRRNGRRSPPSNPEPFRRVYRVLPRSDLEQQPRVVVVAADGPDPLTRVELLAHLDGDALKVRAHRIELIAVLEDHG